MLLFLGADCRCCFLWFFALQTQKSNFFKAEKAIDLLLHVADSKKGKMLFPEVDQAVEVLCVYKKPASTNPGMLKKKM